MSQWTLVDNVLHGFWFPTVAVQIGGPFPVWNQFSIDQCRQERSKPVGKTNGSATRDWFTTSVSAHSSLHAELAVISSGGESSQTGFLDDRQVA